MTRRTYTLIAGIVVLAALIVAASLLPTQYAAMGPGVTFNTLGRDTDGKQVVDVTGRETNKVSGNLNMTTVSELDKLDILSAIRGWFDSDEAVVPREVLFPPDKTSKQIQQEDAQDFIESQDSALSAALTYLHYPNKVVVVAFADKSPAKGVLATGDAIEQVNGHKVTNYKSLQAVMEKVAPGTPVSVTYQRGKKTATARVTTTTPAKKSTKGAAFGISVSYQRFAPFNVTFNLKDIGGPSAGLMFALGLLDKIGNVDLTGGRFIAGTGTIRPNGAVGPIGGIPLKMIGARRAGATIFLVPQGNCAEAKAHHPSGLRLVKVTSLQSAVKALKTLNAGGNPPSC